MVWAQPAVDYDALRKAVREYPVSGAKGPPPQPAQASKTASKVASKPDSKADRDLYNQSAAETRKALAAGEYDKAKDLATLLVQGWPNDAAAKELLAQAQKGKAGGDTKSTQPAPPASEMFSATAPALKPPKTTKHEVFVSGDFLLGQGTVTLPVGFSLHQSIKASPTTAIEAKRSSIYYGGTVSYSYGQAWYVDLSYIHGESSGSQDIDAGWLGKLPTDFTITDEWYQAYLRYTFPSLRGKRFFAYLRAGASFVQADLKIKDALLPSGEHYKQTDKTQDMLGNLGFGLGYWLYRSPRLRFGLQMEGEGFYGTRTQESEETLSQNLIFNTYPKEKINNTPYGGIGRVTMRLEMPLGHSGLFKAFMDGGAQGRFTQIGYSGATTKSSGSELLWGPYVKLGLRYAF